MTPALTSAIPVVTHGRTAACMKTPNDVRLRSKYRDTRVNNVGSSRCSRIVGAGPQRHSGFHEVQGAVHPLGHTVRMVEDRHQAACECTDEHPHLEIVGFATRSTAVGLR